tara:strand:+ start:5493 stop:6326 length:834 start_codon:yes stop_codon:yes gene_type:complete
MNHERGKHLDLFSGIGGFTIGAEAAGWETVAFAECDPFCQKILGRHWPEKILFSDVREVACDLYNLTRCELCEDYFCELCNVHFWECNCMTVDGLYEEFGQIDLITAGWPCQDLSRMGNGAGLAGARSGLWDEVRRIVEQIRPAYALVENSANVLAGDRGRWFGRICGDLAGIGYDSEWRVFRSDLFGVRQKRERVFLLAYDSGRIRSKPHKRALLPTEISAAPFERCQPEPFRMRIPNGPTDGVDIGKRISSCSNAIVPSIAYNILKNLPLVNPNE